MAGRKSSDEEVAERRARVAELYLQGKTQVEIGAIVERSQPQISEDLKWCREEWARRRDQATDAWIAEQLVRLDELERQAYQQWFASFQDQERRKVLQITTGEHTPAGKPVSVEKTTTEKIITTTVGDPRFLAIILSAIRERSKLLGLYAPDKLDANLNVSNTMSEAELEENYLRLGLEKKTWEL